MSLIYVATPYSDPDPIVRERRFQAVNRVAAEMMGRGLHIFSPVSHTHPIALAGDLPKGWEFWEQCDRVMLAACSEVVVLMLPGWRGSTGVQAEIKIAEEIGLPVSYMDPPTTSGLTQKLS